MALIVETGAVVPNANSYADLTFAAAYHAALGNADWAGDSAALEPAMIVAARALEQLYGADLKGVIASDEQQRVFPRDEFTDNLGRLVKAGTVPTCWKEAQCEIARMHLTGEDVFPTESDPGIKSFSFTAGDYSEQTEYVAPAKKEKHAGFRKVELLLQPILKKAQGNWRLRA